MRAKDRISGAYFAIFIPSQYALGYVLGPIFTWSNDHQEPHTIRECLVMACSNAAWSQCFSEARVHHLTSPYSDYSPLLVELCPRAMWDLQARGSDKIILVGIRLSAWGRSYGREVRNRIKQLEDSLVSIRQAHLTENVKAREFHVKDELTKLITQEETFWKQRSKDLWLKEGDRNTSFFHAKASRPYQINSIRKLRKSDGTWTASVEGVQQCILEYF
ncbi:UNVERIFIED_CONTAM: hypothetical protein Slati_4305200 [Sesamum latifolium]|uniref:Reverse transcriptase n=1 Tax=Sesamum latifolium TaxID=2727402 RepID=A0AAW2SMR0_9LAMI